MDLSQRPLQLALALARSGAVITVVGGLARRLRGEDHRPRDLDVVVETAGSRICSQGCGPSGSWRRPVYAPAQA